MPIRTPEQRLWLDRPKQLVGFKESLIPADKSYIQQRNLYDRLTHKLGYQKLHGLRHAYAQNRYHELAGWAYPMQGGKSKKDMTAVERATDYATRLKISKELGHSRTNITNAYLGK